jgi:transposase
MIPYPATLFDQHARSITLRRIARYKVPEHVAVRACILAGAVGRYADVWATLDEFGAWCARSEDRSVILDAQICGGLPRRDKRILRRLLCLADVLADREAYSDLVVVRGDGQPSRRHLPHAHRDSFAQQACISGGSVTRLFADGTEGPVRPAAARGRA